MKTSIDTTPSVSDDQPSAPTRDIPSVKQGDSAPTTEAQNDPRPTQWCRVHDKEEWFIMDPYILEVHGYIDWVWMCADCEAERHSEI